MKTSNGYERIQSGGKKIETLQHKREGKDWRNKNYQWTIIEWREIKESRWVVPECE